MWSFMVLLMRNFFLIFSQWCICYFSEIPCFYMNGHRALSGAQETETFVKTFDIIAQKGPVTGPIEGLIDI